MPSQLYHFDNFNRKTAEASQGYQSFGIAEGVFKAQVGEQKEPTIIECESFNFSLSTATGKEYFSDLVTI